MKLWLRTKETVFLIVTCLLAFQLAGCAGIPVQPVSAGTMAASGSSLTITLPPLSVTTIDVH